MKDTWAGGVAWWLTGKVYDYELFRTHLHYSKGQYTGLIKDLIDGYDSSDLSINVDNVSGFTMPQIENAFRKNTTWESLKTYLKTLKVAKDEDIDEIFDFWN